MKNIILATLVLAMSNIAFAAPNTCYNPQYKAPTGLNWGQVTLFTPKSFWYATRQYPSPDSISSSENIFSIVDRNFCIRKQGAQYFQFCKRSTLRAELLGTSGAEVEFGVIGDETATFVKIKANFNDVKFDKGQVIVNGENLPGLIALVCTDSIGRTLRTPEDQRILKVKDIDPSAVYVVRIYSAYYHNDVIAKMKFQDKGEDGVAFFYELLAIDDMK